MTDGRITALNSAAPATGLVGMMVLRAVIVGAVIFAAALFGNFTRPVGHLSAFWPANALLLGLMVRDQRLANPLTVLFAAVGYICGDLLMGGTLFATLLLTTGNLVSALAGFALFSRLSPDDRRLKRPLSVLYLVLIVTFAAAASGIVGSIANPLLFQGDPISGWQFWFISELVNHIAILPVVLTIPAFTLREFDRRRRQLPRVSLVGIAPAVALALSCIASLFIGGPGAVAIPVPALLWCSLSYGLFTTAVLTLAFSIWTLLAISMGHLNLTIDNNAVHTVMSVRIGVALVALAPLTVASVTAARSDLLRRLQHLAAHDQLTGLLNRSGFRDRAVAALKRLPLNRSAAMLMLDLDHFKRINDNYGHAAGDHVLVEFAKLASTYVRDTDAFGRIGGEEFALLLTDCPRSEAEGIAERIRKVFADSTIELDDGRAVSTSVSLGIAYADQSPSDIEPLLRAADKALYRAKQDGRNRVVSCSLAEAMPDRLATDIPAVILGPEPELRSAG